MAFTDTEKAEVLYYLGYPAKVIDPDSLEYNSLVNSRLVNFPEDFEAFVRKIVVDIKELEAQLKKSQCTMGTKQVGDIVLNPDKVASNLKREFKRLLMELSEVTNIRYISKRLGSSVVKVRF